MNRRHLLAALGLSPLVAKATEEGLTPRQTAGPFHPSIDQADKDLDLTRVTGRTGRAQGEVIQIQGQIRDQKGQPVPKATVEIWQANKVGRYAHPNDTNKAALDPDFQGWGIVTADDKGKYQFLTIKPGAYPAGAGWERPPHIHFTIKCLGYHELTTQLYFDGEKLNDIDKILLDTAAAERKSLIVKFAPAQDPKEGKILLGEFNIVLRKAGEGKEKS